MSGTGDVLRRESPRCPAVTVHQKADRQAKGTVSLQHEVSHRTSEEMLLGEWLLSCVHTQND